MRKSIEYLQESNDGIKLFVIVIPDSEVNEIAGIDPWRKAVKIRVNAPATENRANMCLVNFLSNILSIPEECIEIVSGLKAREKTIIIRNINKKDIMDVIEHAANKKA
jgi:uncharacterized protein (TIGR00251 family)